MCRRLTAPDATISWIQDDLGVLQTSVAGLKRDLADLCARVRRLEKAEPAKEAGNDAE